MITKIEPVENLLKIGNYEKLYRVNKNGLRIYVRPEPFAYFSGLTGALSASQFNGKPSLKRLKSWRESMVDSFGSKNTDTYIDFTAEFGTLTHRSLVTIKEKGEINWQEESDMAYDYFIGVYKEKNLEPDVKIVRQMVYSYQKHVASLMQFIHERVQEIYAIEVPVIHEELKIATPIDLVCLCRQTAKGDLSRTVINLKTSSQISDEQIEQVSAELNMWNATYEKEDSKFGAILRTKDFVEGKTPTYEYKSVSYEESFQIFNQTYHRMKLCLNSDATYYPNPTTKSFSGVTKVGQEPTIIVKTIEQEWNEIQSSQPV